MVYNNNNNKTDREKGGSQIIKFYQKYINLFLSVCKLIIVLLAISTFTSVSSIIHQAMKAKCTENNDVLTQLIFIKLDKRIETSILYLWIQFCIDLASVPFSAFMTWLTHLNPHSNVSGITHLYIYIYEERKKEKDLVIQPVVLAHVCVHPLSLSP